MITVNTTFDIGALREKRTRMSASMYQGGKITINEYQETFLMALDEWSLQEYMAQWDEGIQRLATHLSSCLVVNVTTLTVNPRIALFALYKVNYDIFIRYQVIGGEWFRKKAETAPHFDRNTCYAYVNTYKKRTKTYSPDEWIIEHEALDHFLKNKKLKTKK